MVSLFDSVCDCACRDMRCTTVSPIAISKSISVQPEYREWMIILTFVCIRSCPLHWSRHSGVTTGRGATSRDQAKRIKLVLGLSWQDSYHTQPSLILRLYKYDAKSSDFRLKLYRSGGSMICINQNNTPSLLYWRRQLQITVRVEKVKQLINT